MSLFGCVYCAKDLLRWKQTAKIEQWNNKIIIYFHRNCLNSEHHMLLQIKDHRWKYCNICLMHHAPHMTRLNQYFLPFGSPFICKAKKCLHIIWLEVMPKVKSTNQHILNAQWIFWQKLRLWIQTTFSTFHVSHTHTSTRTYTHNLTNESFNIFITQLPKKGKSFIRELFMLMLFRWGTHRMWRSSNDLVRNVQN